MTQPLCKCNVCGVVLEAKEAALHACKKGKKGLLKRYNSWELIKRPKGEVGNGDKSDGVIR